MRQKNRPNITNRAELRRQIILLLMGIVAGAGITRLSLLGSRHSTEPAAAISASTPEPDASALTSGNSADAFEVTPDDELARGLAEKVLKSLVSRDANGIAASCDLPFLGGAPHNPKMISEENDLINALDSDLCRATFFGPFMYETKWDLGCVLTPDSFFEQFAGLLASRMELRRQIQELRLNPGDRIVAESHRGMLLFVRMQGEIPRLIGIIPTGFRAPQHQFQLTRDLIYGRKYGTALTLDLLQPLRKSNGAALLELNNGSFVSPPKQFAGIPKQTQALLDAGYTVIYVTPSGTPKHSIPEILADAQRAVRFIRFNAERFHLEPDRLAVMGISSGGYLAHMLGVLTAPIARFPPESDPATDLAETDPVEAVSSCVQAVISYAGPTDWMNYGSAGKTILEHELPALQTHRGVFDLYEFDPVHFGFNKVIDRQQQLQQLQQLSPINLVSASSAPTLIFHGERDENVPVEQAERMQVALAHANVAVQLVVKRGAAHGWNWADHPDDDAKIVDWLNQHLQVKQLP